MDDLSKRIDDLSPEKRALLMMRLKNIRESTLGDDGKIARRLDPTSCPLSYAQQRMWFLNQWEPESPFYNIPSIIKIIGHLNVAALNQAIMSVFNRHDILRAQITSIDGKPVQTIMGSEILDIQYENLSSLPDKEKNERINDSVNKEIRTGFDLSADTLLRCKIIECEPVNFYLLITMHHVVSDGWSIGVFINEVTFFYNRYANHDVQSMPDLPIQYPDFAEWQRQRLNPPFLLQLVDYWKNQLGDEQEFLELPLDFARPGVQSFNGAHFRYSFPSDLYDRLLVFCKKHEVSIFMLMMTGFQILLYRYTSQDEIRIGIPVANRNRKELEGLIGLFVNTIVINGRFTQDVSFLDFLNQIKEKILGGYAHQELPFEMLLEELRIIRDLSHTPLFQAMLTLQTHALKSLKISNLEFSIVEPENGSSKFDLTLFLEETGKGLDGIFEYNTDLFLPSSIGRMASQLTILFSGIIENDNQVVGKIPLLTPVERQEILGTWNNLLSVYPSSKNLAELFEKAVDLFPESIAVSFPAGDQSEHAITYKELNQRVNQLARYIQRFIHQQGDLIALFMDRSLEMVIATLAIIKSGCAYLPIDLGYPPDRVTFMLEDGQVPVIITNLANIIVLKEYVKFDNGTYRVNIICLDDNVEAEKIQDESVDNLNGYPSSETAAYVMYTSGSTGKPKGVAVPHRAIARLVFNTNYLPFGPDERIAHISNPSFDAATFEIWGALLHGGHLVGIPKDIALDTQRYVRFIREKQVTSTFLTVALFNHIVREDPDAFYTMNTVMFGGEAADLGSLRRVLEHRGPKRLINGYGPTESTTFAAWFQVEKLPEKITSLPIGKPLTNTLLYILDKNLEPVPVGVPGELYIGGDGLALGYFKRPELNSEKFLLNPFIDQLVFPPGVQLHDNRIYKTGDRVRYLPDGNIEFLGRFDFQVKLRGLRIELGEIETAIGSYTPIAGNIVILREDIPGEKRLVSYYVTEKPGSLDNNKLREYLKKKLPEFMIPSAFVYLDKFPLNPNGKIDRKQLPVPGDLSLGVSEDYYPSTTPEEEKLSVIWQDLLGIQHISIHDNFFALGGHSLLVTQLISRIRTQFAIELHIKNIFEYPSIYEQAILLNRKSGLSYLSHLPTLDVVPRGTDFPLTFSQQRLWFLEQLKPGSPDYNIPTAVYITGNLDEAILKSCLRELLVRHESLRMIIKTVEGKPCQEIIPALDLPYRSLDISSLEEKIKNDTLSQVIRDEAQKPFNLSIGPLVRFLCIRLSGDQFLFLLVFHHIISDGWSANIFYRELASLYRAIVGGETSPLDPLTYQYVDYAVWQRKILQGEFLEKELEYWKKQLADAVQLLELPTDFVRPALQSGQGDFITFDIDENVTQRIHKQCDSAGVTLFMYLFSTFSVLLYRYTNQEDFCIGTPVANRDHEGIESIIGFFVNTLVIRSVLDGDQSFIDVLQQVRSTAMDAFTHSVIPFEMVVDAVDPVRDLSFNPIFQVMFTFQEDIGPTYQQLQSSFTLNPVDVHGGISIFDLTLTIAKSGDQLRGSFEFSTDLFRRETVSRMIDHFLRLLNEFLLNPNARIDEPSLLSELDRQKIKAWNETATVIPDVCLHELFHQVACVYPDRIAILEALCDGEKAISYQELDECSEKLASYLNRVGVGPHDIVGICLERNFDLYISLLGTLKSGAAYLPLDPTYPRDRLEHMITDSHVSVVISQQNLLEFLSGFNIKVVDIANDWKQILAINPINREPKSFPVNPSDPAYIIYTSGSTGKPKGVMVSHRSVLNHNLAIKSTFNLSPTDRILQFSTINFDAAVEEIFPAWFSGATVVIPPLTMITRGSLLITANDLTNLVVSEQITILDFSTAFWHEWVYELAKIHEFPECIRLVVVGGEKARRDVYDKWLELVPEQVVWLNTYGPTEAAIVATIYEPDQLLPPGQDIPIGKPIANLHGHILDKNQNLVPVGLPGELYLGGVGVAIGYLNQPEMNSTKFFPDILFPGERMYKTGDKARWLETGNLEFLGRVDSQVKIRGFRIEIDEIETHILAFPVVKDVVVIAVTKGGAGNSNTHMLAAYIVVDPAVKTSEMDIRTHLKSRIPDYMIPGAFRFIDELPKLPNGKVNRKGLPELEFGGGVERSYKAPADEIEHILVDIWQDVLGIPKIGVHENFFELGGDSILSIQVVSRARKMGLSLQPRHLFEAQTIAELARQVEPVESMGSTNQGEIVGAVRLTPVQKWFFDQEFSNYSHWNQAILVEVKQKLDENILEEIFRILLTHHDALRIRFHRGDDGQWYGDIRPPDEDLPIRVVDLSALDEQTQAQKLNEIIGISQSSLDIENGPLLQLVYFRMGDSHSDRLFMVIHHLVIDGVSWRIILDDLQNLYGQRVQGFSPVLPLKTTSIKEWSELLNQYSQTEDFTSEIDFWQKITDTLIQPLPVDFPNQVNEQADEGVIQVNIDQAITGSLLRELPTRFGADMNDALIYVLSKTLTSWVGSSKIRLDLEGHGREDILNEVDLSRTVGWFTSVYPVVINIDKKNSLVDSFISVKEQIRKIPHHGINFGIIHYLKMGDRPKLDSSEISFNYLGQVSFATISNSIFYPARESSGMSLGPANRRSHLIDFIASIVNGELCLEWRYSKNIHRKETIEEVSSGFNQKLLELYRVCNEASEVVYTPSDFKDVDLRQDEIDLLMQELGLDEAEDTN